VNKDESLGEAVAREVFEETGLSVLPLALVYQGKVPNKNEIVHIFLCKKVAGSRVKTSNETLDVQIFTKRKRPKACFETHENVISNLFARQYDILMRNLWDPYPNPPL